MSLHLLDMLPFTYMVHILRKAALAFLHKFCVQTPQSLLSSSFIARNVMACSMYSADISTKQIAH